MQKLQLERRQRMEDYLKQQVDWPGFDDHNRSNYIEELWDTQAQPVRSATPSAVAAPATDGVWQVWPTTFGLGGSPGPNSAAGVPQQRASTVMGMGGLGSQAEPEGNNFGFNSLQMDSVWGSQMPKPQQQQPSQEDLEMQQHLIQQQMLQQQQQQQQMRGGPGNPWGGAGGFQYDNNKRN